MPNLKRLAAALAAVVAAVALLAGCDDHKGEHCVATQTILLPISTGKTVMYVPSTQCVQWVKDSPAASQ